MLFCPKYTNFLTKLVCFVIGKLFQPSPTNTLAEYENPLNPGQKCFITLAPGVNVIKPLCFVTDGPDCISAHLWKVLPA